MPLSLFPTAFLGWDLILETKNPMEYTDVSRRERFHRSPPNNQSWDNSHDGFMGIVYLDIFSLYMIRCLLWQFLVNVGNTWILWENITKIICWTLWFFDRFTNRFFVRFLFFFHVKRQGQHLSARPLIEFWWRKTWKVTSIFEVFTKKVRGANMISELPNGNNVSTICLLEFTPKPSTEQKKTNSQF